MSQEPVERFHPTSGRILGVLALVILGSVVAIGLIDREHGFPMPVVAAALVGGVLVWASMLRPGVWVTEEHLVLRNMLNTLWVPLAAIEQVVVRQVLAVRAGEKRFVSPAIGRSWRQTMKANRAKEKATAVDSYPVYVEERISQHAEDARAKLGITLMSDEQLRLADDVRRSWAWPEIVALGASGILFVVAVVT